MKRRGANGCADRRRDDPSDDDERARIARAVQINAEAGESLEDQRADDGFEGSRRDDCRGQ